MEGLTEASASSDSAMLNDFEKLPSSFQYPPSSETHTPLHLGLPDSIVKLSTSSMPGADVEGNRLSFSSLYSVGSAIYSGATGGSSVQSIASSNAGSIHGQPSKSSLPMSPTLGTAKGEASSATTATDPVSVTANSHSPHSGLRATQFMFGKFYSDLILCI